MAFVLNALTKICDLNPPVAHAVVPGPGLFLYDSGADALATVVAAGYFNNARNFFPGAAATSMIIVMCTDGFRIVRVTAPATGNVTVAAQLGAVS